MKINANLRGIAQKIENLKHYIGEIDKEISDIEDLGHVVVSYSSQTIQDFSTGRNLEWRMNVPHEAVLANLMDLHIDYTNEIKKLLVRMREEALGK